MTSMATKKIQIEIAKKVFDALDELAKHRQLSRGQLIRKGIEAAIKSDSALEFKRSFGAWTNKKQGGLEFQRKIRKDWD
jgi:metal-responsive CopG/Arc/MetJ family transcriptional regulator